MVAGDVVAGSNKDLSLRVEQQDTYAGAERPIVFCHVIWISIWRP
jgi:hypothetical protein